eukprot:scaffold61996_cov64-Phaeocystis_antarctica.AAC.4
MRVGERTRHQAVFHCSVKRCPKFRLADEWFTRNSEQPDGVLPRDFSVSVDDNQMDLTHFLRSPLVTPGAALRRPWSELIDEQTSASFY